MQEQRIFMVDAFPEQRSFTAALSARARCFFMARGSVVRSSNLYQMGFNPVASAADFDQRANPDYLVYALEQRHAWAERCLADDIRAEVDKLLWCDLLILVFPLYWFSVPAILKGWFDRVLLSGLTHGGRRFYNRAPLRGKRGMLVLTTGGRSHMLVKGGIHGAIENLLRHVQVGTLQYVGIDVLAPFVAYHVPYIDSAGRAAYLKSLSRHLAALDTLPALPMPSLDDYDTRMHPLTRRRDEAMP